MKKQLLFGVALSVCFAAVAQNRTVKPLRADNAKANQAVKVDKSLMTVQPADEFSNYYKSATPVNRPVKTTSTLSEAVVGKTYYDLQTNRSVMNRIQRYSDGTTATVWTFTSQTTGWTDRGAGYNYNDGTDLVNGWGANPSARVESERAGFPEINKFLNGGEVVVSHAAANMKVNTRATKGTGTWSEVNVSGTPAATFWPRVGTDGNQTIHILDNTNATVANQTNACTYSRSKDGGATWDKAKVILSEIDSVNYLGFGGDQYSVDADGNTVAIVMGDYEIGCFMLKSTDGGDTWTKTTILPFPIAKYDGKAITDINNDQIADTIETCDGAVHVRLDANGKAHVAFGRMFVVSTDTANGMGYFPATDGLMYWNENMGASAPIIIAGVQDLNGDTALNLPNDTTKAMPFGRYFTSLSSHPSIGFDANGIIYMSYSSIMEGTDLNGRAFRHTYVMASEDQGATWGVDTVIDVVADPFTEGVYGSIAKHVDNYVHLVYQRDFNPGFGVSATAANGGDIDNIGIENEWVYVAVPVSDILIGVDKKAAAKSSLGVYPNPANDQIMLSFNGNNANVSIVNIVGQQVASFANVSAKQPLNVANLTSGVYFVNVTVNGAVTTEKLIIE